MIAELKVKALNLMSERPSAGLPKYRVCDECGKPAEFGKRWRSGVSMPDTKTKTLCDSCGPE